MFRSSDHLQGATLFLVKSLKKKQSLINFLILTRCRGSQSHAA